MVLIINTSKKQAQSVSDIFYYMGIISCFATPKEAFSEISDLYRAVIVLNPESFPDIEDFVTKIKSYASSVPIFAISDVIQQSSVSSIFDECFSDTIYSSELAERIMIYQNQRNMPVTGHYRLAGIDASCYNVNVNVFEKTVPFTKTETMILRYLISSYPIPQSPANILKYAFKPTRKPEITSIRTHISVMNKKFRDITDKNLFVTVPKLGYAISTPEILKSLNEAT